MRPQIPKIGRDFLDQTALEGVSLGPQTVKESNKTASVYCDWDSVYEIVYYVFGA